MRFGKKVYPFRIYHSGVSHTRLIAPNRATHRPRSGIPRSGDRWAHSDAPGFNPSEGRIQIRPYPNLACSRLCQFPRLCQPNVSLHRPGIPHPGDRGAHSDALGFNPSEGRIQIRPYGNLTCSRNVVRVGSGRGAFRCARF
ncbi:MAG: hypothetical protein HXX08_23020 [Chloroflexi bacterium]|uniref:Uncharacterized protein n=1 Tax=Candidatus Chlorohelix allophototropha TaxID=3003348 RepID=A0A8T7M9M8_9CHLR|nr:hypothetical protein [Chloroflexota bacterium]